MDDKDSPSPTLKFNRLSKIPPFISQNEEEACSVELEKNDLRIVQGLTAALGLTPTGDSASRSATERRDSRTCQPTKN